jgi:hypothetical protein
MALYNVSFALTRLVPDTPLSRSQTAVWRSLEAIYNQVDWSWQKGFAGWLSPGIVFKTGTFTTKQYSDQVIADAAATAALLAYTGQPLITQLQYRNPAFSIYDIVGYDDGTTVGQGNYPFATLTLDRPWMEPGNGTGQPYFIYQHYFVAPVRDFKKWIAIQDFTNNQPLDFWSLTRADLANLDPQRQDQSLPTNVVPAGIDQRPGSATYGWQRFELYPWQGNLCPYTLSYRRLGQLPQSQSDWMTMMPQAPITENMVEFKAKEILLLDKAAEMEGKTPGSGKGMVLLSALAQKKYQEYFEQVFSVDLNLDGENMTHVNQPGKWQGGDSFATLGGKLNLGGYPTGRGV